MHLRAPFSALAQSVPPGFSAEAHWRRLRALVSVLAVLLLAPAAFAVTFNDGAVHVIDAANSFPAATVQVQDGPASPTTVTLVAGGQVGTLRGDGGSPGARGIGAFGNSQVNIQGGEAPFLDLLDTAVGDISGGRMRCRLSLFGSSQATLSGGDLGSVCSGPTIFVEDDATLTITGGIIQRSFSALGRSVVDVTGGIFGTLADQAAGRQPTTIPS